MTAANGPDPSPEERPGDGLPVVFHRQMCYRCDHGCGWERAVLLEVGCNRIPDERFWAQIEVEDVGREARRELAARRPVPVPFVGGGCPNCQGVEPPWDPMGATLKHVAWNEDRTIEPVVGVPEDRPHFRYPPDAENNERACGVLVLPDGPSFAERVATRGRS